jgi:hypothetical protein
MSQALLHPGAPAIPGLIEWLVGDECRALDDKEMIEGLGARLRAAGLPLDRLTLHLRTLHPQIIGRTLAWAPGEPVEILDREYGVEILAQFAESPLRQVMETRRPMVVRLDFRLQRALLADQSPLVPRVTLPTRGTVFGGGHGHLHRSRPLPPQRRVVVDPAGTAYPEKGAVAPRADLVRLRPAPLHSKGAV